MTFTDRLVTAMPDATSQSEPSMEEIIASISRVIAEDIRPGDRRAGAVQRDRRREKELPLGGAERTMGDVVREMLRPMLQSWLDEHLPGIVEQLVREEIARVVAEAGLR